MKDWAVSIRGALVTDAFAIAAIEVASWRAAYRDLMPQAYLDGLSVEEKTANWRRSLRGEDARGKRTCVAVDDADAPLGFATVGPDAAGGAMGMLLLMYVTPEAWGIGAGRALMQAARDALADLGFSDAVLWVLEANDHARRFYERAGWRPDGATHADDYGGVELPAVRYVQSLNGDER